MSDVARDVEGRFETVRDRIHRACRRAGRDPAEVLLVAVSKRQPPERLAAALALGHRDFGENYAQELHRKQAEHPEARWHFIGHLQRNKAKLVVDAALVHGVDSARLGRALDQQVESVGRVLPVLVQVHQGDEATKAGVPPDEVEPLLSSLRGLSHLEVQGLMTLPPPGEGPRHFAALAALRDRLRGSTGLELPHLSMGMSDDFEDAIQEGATIVRVGTALFGARPQD